MSDPLPDFLPMLHDAPGPDGPALALRRGQSWPLGASLTEDAGEAGVNFAVWAPDAEAIELCLFDAEGREELHRLALPACSEGVWHGFLPSGAAGLTSSLGNVTLQTGCSASNGT